MKRALLLCGALAAMAVGAAQAPPEPSGLQFRSGTNEIVLDVVVTDKKGRPVTDLKKDDIAVTDNGVKQQILGFRLVDATVSRTSEPHLITLLFENMDADARRQARVAGMELLKTLPPDGIYVAVAAVNQQLCLLQPFTTDREALKAAVELATGGQPLTWIEHSNKEKSALAASLSSLQGVEKRLGQTVLDMTKSAAVITEGPRATIFSMLSLVRGQRMFPGRKGVIYISWGMVRPPHLDEPFRNLISEANRANVSFYPISALGVATWSQNAGGAAQMRGAAAISADAVTRDDGRVNSISLLGGDLAETAPRMNIQQAMKELADGTGGQYFADTNDFRKPVRAAVQELSSYYEIAYNPGIENYDGSFRRTEVQVARHDVHARARDGYYALPVTTAGESLMSYEMPLVKALQSQPLSREVAYQAAAVRFQPAADVTASSILVEVPMSSITFAEDPEQKRYRTRLSLIAIVKNAKGEIVGRFSHDLPLVGPLDRIAAAKAGRFLYKERISLPPGRYLLETAVLDHGSNKLGAKRASLVVPPAGSGIRMSHLTVVRRFDPGVKDLDPAEPFQFQGGRVTPTLTGTVYAAKGAMLSLFFVVYPDAASAAKPEGFVEYIKDGAVVGKGELSLPAPDAQGRIPYVMSSPAESMPPGTYEVRAVVKQGETATEERAFVNVEAAPEQ
jgi:VWFA-related protein